MCNICGCSAGNTTIEGSNKKSHHHTHDHHHDHNGKHEHVHDHDHDHHHHHTDENGTHDYGKGPAHAHAPGLSQSRMVQIEQDIMAKNNEYANANRLYFNQRGILALNLLSSPGSGKTTLLTRTISDLKDKHAIAVIEGDQQTANDAERIRETGVPAIQINTGKGCHLDGHMIGHALENLTPEERSLLFIENVGNLVCPASFDLGEAHKIVILSVTEGEDKPLKYPDMFHTADLMLLNKTDLLPHLSFDVERCIENARRINPGIKVLEVSATTGEGMEQFYRWIDSSHQLSLTGHSDRRRHDLNQNQQFAAQ